jgi:DNA topoisomerase-3
VKNCGDIDNVKGDYAVLKTPCPECGKTVQESHRRFNCDSCDFFIWKTLATREFSPEEMEILLAGETTGELEGFRSRMGKEFQAPVRLQKMRKATGR